MVLNCVEPNLSLMRWKSIMWDDLELPCHQFDPLSRFSQSLIDLNLYENKIDQRGVEYLVEALKTNRVRRCAFNIERRFEHSAASQTLKKLNIGANEIESGVDQQVEEVKKWNQVSESDQLSLLYSSRLHIDMRNHRLKTTYTWSIDKSMPRLNFHPRNSMPSIFKIWFLPNKTTMDRKPRQGNWK